MFLIKLDKLQKMLKYNYKLQMIIILQLINKEVVIFQLQFVEVIYTL